MKMSVTSSELARALKPIILPYPTTLPYLGYKKRLSWMLSRHWSTEAIQHREEELVYRPGLIRRRLRQLSRTPKTAAGSSETVYALTLRISKELHDVMTALRKKYFPPKRNRQDAHIILFHALPESKLPHIESQINTVALTTRQFRIKADLPVRLPKGILVPIGDGSDDYKNLRNRLKLSLGSDFLSDLDNNRRRHAHFIIQDRVYRFEEITNALEDVAATLRIEKNEGMALGLRLWKLDQGVWRWRKNWNFLAHGADASPP